MSATNPQPIKIYGHRGARGLAPENTLPAYKTAKKIGVNAIDLDVGMTKDGEIVVTHDYSLNPDITRNPDGSWIDPVNIFIKDLSLDKLKNYDVGRIKPGSFYQSLFPAFFPVDKTPIPTLKEVIREVKQCNHDELIFQIEMKTNPEEPHYTHPPKIFAEALAKILKEENVLHRTEVQAFDYRCLLELQKINAKITTAYLTGDADKDHPESIMKLWRAGHHLKDFNGSIPKMIATLGGKIWGPEDTELTPELVHEAHQLGLKVIPWSWSEKAKMEINIPLTMKLIEMQGYLNLYLGKHRSFVGEE